MIPRSNHICVQHITKSKHFLFCYHFTCEKNVRFPVVFSPYRNEIPSEMKANNAFDEYG